MAGSLEPRTSARCTIWTSSGPLKVELWAKECPRTAFKFLENCVQGRYNGVKFEKKVYDAAVQSSEIENEPWGNLENDSRIKMNRRGLLAVNVESKGGFFITLRETSELDGQVTVLGQLVDNSFYTLLKISEKEFKSGTQDQTYLYPATVERIEVEERYFENLNIEKKREASSVPGAVPKRVKRAAKVQLDYDHEEDEEDDEPSETVNIKITAAHDLLASKGLMRQAPDTQYRHDVSEDVAAVESRQPTDPTDPKLTSFAVPDTPTHQHHNAEAAADSENPTDQLSSREADTMAMLAKFKQRLARSNSLSSHQLNFEDRES
ncbi:LAME_0H08064g1_1 [Lachancea meyersii CBS 8951]|uniref:LAME_0H08064g1_1 n=1 Tax=Lachancea meyersii CBS 8951 TaxID=1266667 RepID=A0A1G4KF96_9SACH|nr:LAME_0H08064g1_1 [Lachancea meyersii CBS 8951]